MPVEDPLRALRAEQAHFAQRHALHNRYRPAIALIPGHIPAVKIAGDHKAVLFGQMDIGPQGIDSG